MATFLANLYPAVRLDPGDEIFDFHLATAPGKRGTYYLGETLRSH